jgi:predicted ATPase
MEAPNLIEKVDLHRFKRIETAELELARINVFVGGNNSGKSCILQGIHFGVALAQARKIAGSEQFPPEQLRYCPTDNFLDLCCGQRLHEGTSVETKFYESTENGEEVASVSLTRGRNGVVKARTTGGDLLARVSDPKGFFSIYVPGLAGISLREEYRSELVVNNGIARGDANLFLRNLLLRLERSEQRKASFSEHFGRVFPGCVVTTQFSEPDHLTISSRVRTADGREFALDMVGTGMLQAIQLIAYITMYQPRLLLLDEPDAHLQPSNQKLLADTLASIVDKSETKVLIATHSRNLLDAFSDYDDAKLFWVRQGVVTEHEDWADVAVLMDLGALDRGEHLLNGRYKYLIWTEDDDTKYLDLFLRANGVSQAEALIFSYKASSKIDAARLLADFVSRVRPGVRTIIHRDRDFMSNDEVNRLREKYSLTDTGATRLFITRGSDIESYFVSAEHLAQVLNITQDNSRVLIETTIQEFQNEFLIKFQSKRNEIKRDLYKSDPEQCPEITSLVPGSVVPVEKALGKLLLKKLGSKIQAMGSNPKIVLNHSESLVDMNFRPLLY